MSNVINIMSDPLSERVMDSVIASAINRGRAGSSDAVGALLELYREYLLTVASERVTGDIRGKVSPSDLVQDTFQRAAENFPEFRGQTEPELRQWLLQILKNRAADVFRQWYAEKRDVSMEVSLSEFFRNGNRSQDMTPGSPSPMSDLIRKDLLAGVYSAIATLSDDRRQVITMYCLEGCDYDEVAKKLNRTPEAVRKLFFRAIEQLSSTLNLHE